MSLDNVKLTPEHVGAIMAFLLAVLRVLSEKDDDIKISKRKLWRMLIEGLICAALAFSFYPVLVYFDIDISMMMPIGALIGHVGSQAIRFSAVSIMNKKAK